MASLMLNRVFDDPRSLRLYHEEIGALALLAAYWDQLGIRDEESAMRVLQLRNPKARRVLAAIWPILRDADVQTRARRDGLASRASGAASARWMDAKMDAIQDATVDAIPGANMDANGAASAECALSLSTQSTESTERERDAREATSETRPPKRGVRNAALVTRPEDVPENIWRDWMAVRGRKPLTETAWALVVREASIAGISVADAVQTCAERGWIGFKASWLTDGQRNGYAPRGDVIKHMPGLPYGLPECGCKRCLELLAAKETA